MKKSIIIILIILNCLYFYPQEKEINYQEKYKNIFNDLYNLVIENKDINAAITQRVSFVKEKIENNEISLETSYELPSTIFGGIGFTFIYKEGKGSHEKIIINPYLIDLYNDFPSIILALLAHEVQHTYDYYHNENFKQTVNNELERYLYEMDSLYIESVFIRDFLVPNNYNITDFEKVIIDSLDKNNLAYASYLFHGIDMELIYAMYGIGKEGTYMENLDEFYKIGQTLLARYKEPKKNDDWNKFVEIVPLISYVKFTNQMIYNLAVDKKGLKTLPEKFDVKKESRKIDKIQKQILKIIQPEYNFYEEYMSQIADHFKLTKYNFEYSAVQENTYEFILLSKDIIYKHLILNPELTTDSLIYDEPLGNSEKTPQIKSEKYNDLIKKSQELYSNKNYKKASEILEKAVIDEPDNPFLLETYARALFWYDNEKSYQAYSKLINLLDTVYNQKEAVLFTGTSVNLKNKKIEKEISELLNTPELKNINKVVIDLWFSEAYWKLGCLYLDRQNYLMGAYEISRAITSGILHDDNRLLREQLMGFLTESYFHLGKYHTALYFANETFKVNPNNKYVIKYIEEIKKNDEK